MFTHRSSITRGGRSSKEFERFRTSLTVLPECKNWSGEIGFRITRRSHSAEFSVSASRTSRTSTSWSAARTIWQGIFSTCAPTIPHLCPPAPLALRIGAGCMGWMPNIAQTLINGVRYQHSATITYIVRCANLTKVSASPQSSGRSKMAVRWPAE